MRRPCLLTHHPCLRIQVEHDLYDDPAEMTMPEVYKQRALDASKSGPAAGGRAGRQQFFELKTKFEQAVAVNQDAAALERLEYKEFVIDHELKQMLEADCARQVCSLSPRVTGFPDRYVLSPLT